MSTLFVSSYERTFANTTGLIFNVEDFILWTRLNFSINWIMMKYCCVCASTVDHGERRSSCFVTGYIPKEVFTVFTKIASQASF